MLLRSPTKALRRSLSAEDEALPESWEASCSWVLAKRISLWDVVLEPSFLQVCKDLLSASLAKLKEDFRTSLTAALELAATAAPVSPIHSINVHEMVALDLTCVECLARKSIMLNMKCHDAHNSTSTLDVA